VSRTQLSLLSSHTVQLPLTAYHIRTQASLITGTQHINQMPANSSSVANRPMATPSLAPSANSRRRKAHDKSRNGCTQCKQKPRPRFCRLLLFTCNTTFVHDAVRASHIFAPLIYALRSLFGQCDEVYPICAHCQRPKLSCSLGAPSPPADPTAAEKQLNLDDLRLLHDWCKGDGTKSPDHVPDTKQSMEAQR